jgi:hypothetical protein
LAALDGVVKAWANHKKNNCRIKSPRAKLMADFEG